MKIIVTGGAGFIGSHITEAFMETGHQVAVVDDLSSGKKENIPQGARFHQVDIRSSDALDEVFGTENPDAVCHQAARANVRESLEKPLLYAGVNVLGSLNLLECCRKYDVGKFIYASTGGAVYGEPLELPVKEDHPINPLDPYGASKHFVEHYLYLYRKHYGIGYVALRYPNVYGPRQDPYGEAGVVAIFAQQMLEGKQPVINGTGEQQRDYIYVSEVARANVLALQRDGGDIFNIGGGIGTSVNQIFDDLAQLTGYFGEPVHGPAKAGEVYKIFLNASQARRKLGWQPKVSLKDGLTKTVNFFKNQHT